jgi:hypothetical protein
MANKKKLIDAANQQAVEIMIASHPIVAARMPVYLRINTPVTRNAARLICGLPGSALTARGSHPLDG